MFRDELVVKSKTHFERHAKGLDVETFFAKLTDFVKELNKEDQRAVSEQLTDEELALFDLLTKPEIDMTKSERETVKKVARGLLQTLKEAKLVLDWRKKQEARAGVYSTITKVLDELPRVYSKEIYDKKCETVFQHISESYQGEGRSIYTTA